MAIFDIYVRFLGCNPLICGSMGLFRGSRLPRSRVQTWRTCLTIWVRYFGCFEMLIHLKMICSYPMCSEQDWYIYLHPMDPTVDGRNPANHLGSIRPCRQWDKLPTSTGAGFFPSTVSGNLVRGILEKMTLILVVKRVFFTQKMW